MVFVLYSLLLVAGNALTCMDSWGDLNLFGWLYMVYCLAVSTAFYLLPWMLLGSRAKAFYRVTMPILVFLDCALVFVHTIFHFRLDGVWIGILLTSNRDEVAAFLAQHGFGIAAAVAAMCVGWTACVLVLRRFPVFPGGRAGNAVRIAALVLAGVGLAAGFSWTRNGAAYFLFDTVRSCGQQRRLARMAVAPRFPSALGRIEPLATNAVGVLVIGESATRSHFGLFGYGRETTPRLDALRDELILFPQARASSLSTAQALTHLLTTATLERPDALDYTFPQVLKSAGYSVSLVSNQRHWGEYDSTTHAVFAGCDEMTFVAERKCGGARSYDHEMLPEAERVLKGTGPRVAILHQLGSHAFFACNYPPDKAFFPVRTIDLGLTSALARDRELKRNHYDNTIRYTDELLGDLIARLKATSRLAWLVYVSDHGETPDIPGWRVATEPSTWEIPLLIWLSPDFRSAFASQVRRLESAARAPIRSDHLLPLLQSLTLRPPNPSIR